MGIDRSEKEQLYAMVLEQARRARLNAARDAHGMMYPWQREFIGLTKQHYECCLCAANQIGKTFTGTTIDALHLLGDYPEDWGGHKFERAPMCWALGYSMEKTRDLLQTAMFGSIKGGKFEGGLIPAERIVSHESVAGTVNAVRTVRVKHSSGGTSTIQFWSYKQGQHALMGDKVDWFHVDEEPRDQTIRPQILTRTLNGDGGNGGRGIYTFTPENGRTDLVVQFMDSPSEYQAFMQKGWDDAPHMTKEKRDRALMQYPAHQRDMRTKGEPMLGHGRIYDLADDFITCDPIEIPDHWFALNGLDFGWDHPQAVIKLVEDRDTGTFYVTHCYKARQVSANDAWGATQSWAKGIPTAWPHDGLQHEKGRDSSKQLKEHYADAGFSLTTAHATWPKGGNSVETGLFEIRDLMRKGKFKVYVGLVEWLREFRQHHRDDKGRIVKTNDDLLDATRYAYMMRRYAKRIGNIGVKPKKINFNQWG